MPTKRATKQALLNGRPVRVKKSTRNKAEIELAQTPEQKKRPHRQANSARYKALQKTIQQKRKELAQLGLVEHGMNPIEVLQRAVDDAALDYAILSEHIQTRYGDLVEAALTEPAVMKLHDKLRKEATHYASIALTYNLQNRQQQLSEARVAILGRVLKVTLKQVGLPDEDIAKIPELLQKNLDLYKKGVL